MTTVESLQFDFGTIEAATNKFSADNKLGEGGFGEVYKVRCQVGVCRKQIRSICIIMYHLICVCGIKIQGTLPSGEEIAVKRLSKGSGQGGEEFKNEVVVVAKLQHRNLVRLLGFCLQGEEKILVYEYVPNKSLDYILFGKTIIYSYPERKRCKYLFCFCPVFSTTKGSGAKIHVKTIE